MNYEESNRDFKRETIANLREKKIAFVIHKARAHHSVP